jgi:CHAT domain-containing protein
VAEHSSVELVGCFFTELKEGRSRIDALRAAQQRVRRMGYDHPFFWAPFILMGEGR